MTSRISVLPDHIINQIAAGEVVQAPFNVVKELVENAIDAKSSFIHVFIEDGGLSRIMVMDNGQGMSEEDLLMAIKRHATSKLESHNIYSVTTRGFRGEALPAIAAVSRLTITSKKQDHPAWSLCLDSGNVVFSKPASSSQGSSVEVSALFHTIPARLKFLKSTLTETQRIISHLSHLALSAPHIHFKLTKDSKDLLDFPPGTPQERAQHVLKKDVDLRPVNTTIQDTSIHGFIGVPTANKPTSSLMFFLVNNRCCTNKNLITYARIAFGDLIPKGLFPVLVLWLDVPAEDVDINTHPAKLDVRFRNIKNIQSLIIQAINNALLSSPACTSSHLSDLTFHKIRQDNNLAHNPYLSKPTTPLASFDVIQPPSPPKNHASFQPKLLQEPLLGYPKCQIHNTYILTETQEGMILIDQHAAHERIVYETMKNSAVQLMQSKQKLLLPTPLDLTEDQALVLEEWASLLEKWGISAQKKDGKWSIHTLPSLLYQKNIQNIILQFCSQIQQHDLSQAPLDAIHALCSSAACHGSIRAGKVMSHQEMSDLINAMEKLPQSAQCNHGRPTHIRLSKKQMDSLFERA